jgi:hypothetical protein
MHGEDFILTDLPRDELYDLLDRLKRDVREVRTYLRAVLVQEAVAKTGRVPARISLKRPSKKPPRKS